MIPGEAAYAILSAYVPLTSLIGSNIYPVDVPQDTQFPRVVYSVPSSEVRNDFEDPVIDGENLIVDVHARNRVEAHRIGKAVRAAMQTHANMQRVILDEFEPTRKVYRVVMAFLFWTKSSIP